MPKKNPPRRRASPMTDERHGKIVDLLRTWEGRPSWEAVCKAVQGDTGILYTRQALERYAGIKSAFQAAQSAAPENPTKKTRRPPEASKQALLRELEELRSLRDVMLEKFVRWSYNASTRGIDERFLDQPLRQIDRAGR